MLSSMAHSTSSDHDSYQKVNLSNEHVSCHRSFCHMNMILITAVCRHVLLPRNMIWAWIANVMFGSTCAVQDLIIMSALHLRLLGMQIQLQTLFQALFQAPLNLSMHLHLASLRMSLNGSILLILPSSLCRWRMTHITNRLNAHD
jgi:hypothetical protein